MAIFRVWKTSHTKKLAGFGPAEGPFRTVSGQPEKSCYLGVSTQNSLPSGSSIATEPASC